MSESVRQRPRVFIGFSANEIMATNVAEASLRSVTPSADIRRVSRLSLWSTYRRPMTVDEDGRLWDEISNAPMSTDHAIARFWVPFLCDYDGWALFTDGDVIFRQDVADLFDRYADPRYALCCVQHPWLPTEGYKKDYAIQQPYPRKNWSSVMLINCGHPANRVLTVEWLNQATGRALHAFSWLTDDQIGVLPPEWNYLVGVNPAPARLPAIVHFTDGVPTMPGHAQDPYAGEWLNYARLAGYADLRLEPLVTPRPPDLPDVQIA